MSLATDLMAYGLAGPLAQKLSDGVAKLGESSTVASGVTYTFAGTLNVTGTLQLAGVAIAATAAEINSVADESARIVNVTDNSGGLALTQATHSNKIVTMNDADGGNVTLPEATGTGMRFTIVIGTTLTTSLVIATADAANAGFIGHMMMEDADGNFTRTFLSTVTNDLITLNGGTTGGVAGTVVRLTDVATDVWLAEVIAGNENNAPATCFSST